MLALASLFHRLTSQDKMQKRYPSLHTDEKENQLKKSCCMHLCEQYRVTSFQLTCWTEFCGCTFSSGNAVSRFGLSGDTDGATASESERRLRNY